jgi:Ran-binding protein 3
MSPKPNASKTTGGPESLSQTSDDKFKQSGFATLAKASSPFGGLASPGSQSPFGAASGNKLSSFASSAAAPAAPASGFGGFGSAGTSDKSAFGGSAFGSSSGGGNTFGSSLGGGFGAISGSKSALSSFATPADLTIKGLKSKATAFGTPGNDKEAEGSDEEEGSDPENEDEDEKRSSQPLLSQQRTFRDKSHHPFANTIAAQETGEEGEETKWQGRAKLYTMVTEGSTKGWKERGVGTFKFNVTVDEPKKARFVLRADGTHRLLLNAAVTQQLVFGGDSSGGKPKDGRLLFNTPTPDGELEMHLLRVSHILNVRIGLGHFLTICSSKPSSQSSSGKRSARSKRRSYRNPPLSAALLAYLCILSPKIEDTRAATRLPATRFARYHLNFLARFLPRLSHLVFPLAKRLCFFDERMKA